MHESRLDTPISSPNDRRVIALPLAIALAPALASINPDLTIVFGDVDSTIAGTLAGQMLRLPIMGSPSTVPYTWRLDFERMIQTYQKKIIGCLWTLWPTTTL
jgi:hypothetical protein